MADGKDEAPLVESTATRPEASLNQKVEKDRIMEEFNALRRKGIKFRMPARKLPVEELQRRLNLAKDQAASGPSSPAKPKKSPKKDEPAPGPITPPSPPPKKEANRTLVHLAYYTSLALIGNGAEAAGLPEFTELGHVAQDNSEHLDPLLAEIAKKYGFDGGLPMTPEIQLLLATALMAGGCYCAAHPELREARQATMVLGALSGMDLKPQNAQIKSERVKQ